MAQLRSLLKNQKYFLISFALFFLFSCILLVLFSKAQLHIVVNQCYSAFFDHFFKIITFLGDGLFSIIIGVVLLFFSFRKAFLVLFTYAFSGILVQILKRSFFSNFPRPKAFFEGVYQLRFVDGIEIHTSNSFPSGHSATAFALFLSLSIILKNKYLQLVCFVLAVLTAFSRVYLSQHFQIDITFGSLIGVLAVVFYYVWQNSWKANWLDKPVHKVKEK